MTGSLVVLLVIVAVVLVPVRMFGRWLAGRGRELEHGPKDPPAPPAGEDEDGPGA